MAFIWGRPADSAELPDGLLYRAFLSYRSTDKGQAAWLHGRLERYRVPRRLVGKPSAHGPIPARLRPIFRDRDDARSAADLQTIIAQELSKSQQLIVLCTPSAAEDGAWVGREVELFRACRPNAEIHAVIGRGVPPACFPEPLLSHDTSGNLQQPLAADLRPSREGGDGRAKGVIKLVAGLIGANFDDLWRRERRRRAWRVSVAVVVTALATTALGIRIGAERNKTTIQSDIADSRRLAGLASDKLRVLGSNQLPDDQSKSASDQLRENQLDLALLLAVQSYRTAPTYEARNILLTAIAAYPRLMTVLRVHDAVVMALAFSSDGTTLVSGGADRTVVLSDIAVGRLKKRAILTKPSVRLSSMAFSRDGLTAVWGSDDGTVMIWDVPRATQKGVPSRKHQAGVSMVVFSPDGQIVASGSKDEIIFWDASTGQPRKGSFLHRDMGTVFSMAFSPDQKTVAVASGDGHDASQVGEVRLWDLATSTARVTLTPPAGQVRAVAFSPDGKSLASGGWDGAVTRWDLAGRRPKARVFSKKHSLPVVSLAFSPNGKTLASGSWDGTVILWDVATGQPDHGSPLKGRTSSVASVAFSPDGQTLASGGYDRSIILWDTSTPEEATANPWDEMTSGSSVAFSPDGKVIASGSEDGTINLWEASNGQTRKGAPLQGHRGTVTSLAFSQDGKTLVSGDEDGSVIVWDLASGQRKGRSVPRRHTGSVTSVAITSDAKTLAVGSEDGIIVLLSVPGGPSNGASFNAHSASVYGLAFSPDGKILASGSRDNTAKLWDVAGGRGKEEATLDRHTGYAVTRVAFSPNGAIVALGSGDGSVILWDVASRRALGPLLKGSDEEITHLAFRPDGKTVASLSGGVVTLWDTDDESWVSRACRMANRSLSQSEWNQFLGPHVSYRRTCPDPAIGAGARPDVPATPH